MDSKSNESLDRMATWQILFQGIVQGVGFRPYVYRTATLFHIKGTVINNISGVCIIASANEKQLEEFYAYLLNNLPIEAKVFYHSKEEIPYKPFEKFTINKSCDKESGNKAVITPDFAICDKCKEEIRLKDNRRFNYAFTTCTDCGPRYSILQNLPFDRENTSMDEFTQCKECYKEFSSPDDRRFFSQTNSCQQCGISLSVFINNAEKIEGTNQLFADSHITPIHFDNQEDSIRYIVTLLEEGKIVAVKGIGGFLILCDATNASSVKTLRRRKHRPSKPFAVMYPAMQNIITDFHVSPKEKNALEDEAAPIVLLRQKNNNAKIVTDDIAPNLNKIGVFLPYAPLLELILFAINKPLIATSANISGNSVVFSNRKAETDLRNIVDAILLHNREITMPQDDSVLFFTPETQSRVILRAARGLSPIHFHFPIKFDIISHGAMLKNTFGVASDDNIYISQYLGDTDYYDTQENHIQLLGKLSRILNIEVQTHICDLHPDYFTSVYAKNLAKANKADCIDIQHHKAHFYALMGENRLLKNKNVLGCIWDGAGLGEDGNIWGGEFFVHDANGIKRLFHLKYVPHIAGDKMACNPRISALVHTSGSKTNFSSHLFSPKEWNIYNTLLSKSQIKTSSMGRLFDAVAALCLPNVKQSFEGEAAMQLEAIATEYRMFHPDFKESYNFSIYQSEIDMEQMFYEIADDFVSCKERGQIALKFHFTLVNLVAEVAKRSECVKIGFSGGVFQNGLLIDLLKIMLSCNMELYFHIKLSPNDENISFGQIIYASLKS